MAPFPDPLTPPADAVDAVPAPSGVQRVLGNLARLIGGKAMAGLLSLVYLVLATRRLGAGGYGTLVLVNGYALLIGGLVAFSGFHGVVRFGAIAIERADRAGFARIVRYMAAIELGCGALAILVAAVGAGLVGPHLGWSPDTVRFATLYSVAVVGTVRATPQGVLQIAGRFDLLGLHQAVQPLVRLAGAVLVWFTGGGIEQFLTVWLLSAIAEGSAMWLLAWPSWRELAAGEPLRGPWRRPEGQGIGRFIIITNVDMTLRELAPNLAPLTVGWMLGPAAAGLLALAQRATALIAQPTVLLSQASYPVLTGQAARGEHDQLTRTAWRSAGIALAAALPVVLVLAGWGERLMMLVGGKSFGGAATLVVLVALARVAGLAAAPIAAALTATGRPGAPMSVGLTANLGLFPLLPLLLWLDGVNGAGWHALIQSLLSFVALIILFGRRRGARA